MMEYINGGDLMFHMIELGRFPEKQARCILLLCEGVMTLLP